MTNKFIIFSSIILVFFISSFADSAEFYKGVDRTRLLLIYGKIEKGDAQKFKKYIKEIKTERGFLERVFLQSPGGDVLEAIEIGKIIRKNLISTEGPMRAWEDKPNLCFGAGYFGLDITTNCVCDSACFLIWAAGATRDGNALGLHRPYFSKEYFKGLSSSAAKEKYEELSRFVRNYLNNMDIPTELIDKMFSHSSNDIFYLYEYYPNRTDWAERAPFFEEWIIAKCGNFLSMEERNTMTKLMLSRNSGYKLSVTETYALKSLEEKNDKFRQCYKKTIKEAQSNYKE